MTAAAPAPAVEADTEGWVRLHPLTPLLRGGRWILLLLVFVGQRGLQDSSPEAVLGGLAVAVPVALLVGYVAWRTMRYRVTPTELQVESGVLQRRSRRVPLARVQAVDVVSPLYARVFGLAELRLEVVGGGDAEAPLAFLTDAGAHRLRTRLLDLAAGRAESDDDTPPPPADRVLVSVPTRALVVSSLLGVPVVAAAALAVAIVVVALVAGPSAAAPVVAATVPVFLGVGSFTARRLLAEYGFTVAESVDGLRLSHGLLETRTQTIPPGRVQAVRIREPLLWRRRGWVRVEVDVAGYSAGTEQQAATSALLPVAPTQLARDLVARVLGQDLPVADRPAPPPARVRAPLSFRRLRAGLDDRHLVSTHGVLTTTTDIVPLAKVQSLRLTQGAFERRLGLTSLHADTAGRQLAGPVVRHRATAEAHDLLADAAERARRARVGR